MKINIDILPEEDSANGWTAILPSRPSRPALEGRRVFDWAVLGAGFTGLAAARRLARARPDARIAVIDAGAVGDGASGRNSGFAIDHAHSLGGAENPVTAHAQNRLYKEGLRSLRALVKEYKIDCDWRDVGKYHAARSTRGVRKILRPLAHQLGEMEETFRWCDRAEMAGALGADLYQAGVYTPGTALVNPAALVRGLADALPENVTVFENSAVRAIEAGPRVVLKTTRGAVDAGGLILATNAYTPAHGVYRGRLLPLIAFASLTAPMSEDQQAALGGARSWGVTPADGFVSPTIQRTGDNRLLFRLDIFYRPTLRLRRHELARMRERHIGALRERFPMLDDLSVDHTWSGYLCVSANEHSAFGAVADRIWVAAGHQGVGVTRGTIAGQLIADVALGEENLLIAEMQKIAGPPAGPPQPFLDLGVRANIAWRRVAGRHEV
ncbi:MAG: FAD-binding oxidoreductase [Pseudomonadota bacterium]